MSETEEVQLNLKWDNFSSHLALSFDSCYESQQFVDVSLVCKDGEIIKGHKMILANTSKFFRRLLTENEHPHPMIVLHNIDADDLRSLMTFMYCGEVQVFQNDLKKVLEIAEILEITGLQQIQELDNPGIRLGVKNFATLNHELDQTDVAKNDADCSEMGSNNLNKSASNLLKYVSTLGQKNFDNSIPAFESSSKKLQQMAQKFKKSSNVGSWSFLQQTQNSNETRIREISNDCKPKTFQRLSDGEPESLDYKSSSRKLQEMAKLLENINRNPTSSEVSKGTSEGHKRSLESDENMESPAKKLNLNQSTSNNSETEHETENLGLSTSAQNNNPGRSIVDEQLIQNCNVYIKDELEVNTDCSTTPDVDLENFQNESLNITSNGEHSGTSMLAAELLKAVANKRKDTESLHNAIKELTFEVRRQSNEIQELRNCLKRRGFLNKAEILTVQSFAEEHGLTLQLQTVEEFKEFDQRLKSETDFCKNFVSTLDHLLEKEIQKTITAILKCYISRELAISCTAIRRSNDKMIFKGTKFNDCLFALICQHHRREKNEAVTEKEYYQALSSCLSNAKDWHGYRLVRKQQGAVLRLNPNGDNDTAKNVAGNTEPVAEST